MAPSARVRKRFLEGVLGRNGDSLTERERNKILSDYYNISTKIDFCDSIDPERKSRQRFCCDAQRVAATLTSQFVDFPSREIFG